MFKKVQTKPKKRLKMLQTRAPELKLSPRAFFAMPDRSKTIPHSWELLAKVEF